MNAVTAKVCLVGDFGVGKTSLVKRFVHQAFSERYQTTVGVTIETTELALAADRTCKLIIWDIAGSGTIDSVKQSYLRGAAGLLFVADGTRAETLDTAQGLERQARELLGEVPAVYLLNKCDLQEQWEIAPATASALESGASVFRTSALSGDNVEAAFHALAASLAG